MRLVQKPCDINAMKKTKLFHYAVAILGMAFSSVNILFGVPTKPAMRPPPQAAQSPAISFKKFKYYQLKVTNRKKGSQPTDKLNMTRCQSLIATYRCRPVPSVRSKRMPRSFIANKLPSSRFLTRGHKFY